MARHRWTLVLAICLSAAPLWARAFEVKLIKGTEQDGTWGTKEYQVRVTRFGSMRSLRVHGQEVMPHAGALYTSPVPPGGGKPIRTVQGEGVGARGLTIEAPERETYDQRGTRVFRFRHKIAKPNMLDGQTLCLVDQTLTLTPTGEISVEYDCTWVRTCRWHGFSVLMFFSSETVSDCPFMGLRGDHIFTGRLKLDTVSVSAARLREPLEQLTIRTRVGPVHFVWDSPLPTTFSWRKHVQLQTRPREISWRGRILRGVKGRIAYRILVPVSQQ